MNENNLVRTSFEEKDVKVLLKDVTGRLEALGEQDREKKIQKGVHYSELLPKEYEPSLEYMELYENALNTHSMVTAMAVIKMSELIWKHKNGKIVLVSLARAGTPIGVLVKRYLEQKYKVNIPHYSISIIRDRCIDENAMKYIMDRHRSEEIQFVDGWIGKGTIAGEVKKFAEKYGGVNTELAVLADPTGITKLRGTSEDFLIPSSCLNSSVSGLFSRTILNEELIDKDDFHGAVYFEEFEKIDRTYQLIDEIETVMASIAQGGYEWLEHNTIIEELAENKSSEIICAKDEISKIKEEFGVENINLIKPGIGETTRVLMRRVPDLVLVSNMKENSYTEHILRLCREKDVAIREYPLVNYRACGIIKKMSDV